MRVPARQNGAGTLMPYEGEKLDQRILTDYNLDTPCRSLDDVDTRR